MKNELREILKIQKILTLHEKILQILKIFDNFMYFKILF